jgi:hypothetical protein
MPTCVSLQKLPTRVRKWQGGLIDQNRREVGDFAVPEHSAQVAPDHVITTPYGRCYHIDGCWHTRVPRSSPSSIRLRHGLIHFKRCEQCMPSARPRPRGSVGRAIGQPLVQRPLERMDPIEILANHEIASLAILQFLGAHEHYRDVWSRRHHWRDTLCGQSCGCCRASQPYEEDWGSGCEVCQELWYLKTVCRATKLRVLLYDGV